MDKDLNKKKPQTKAEAAASFGKGKEPTTRVERPFKYVETVYNFKDGTCRVREPRYTSSSND